MRTGKFASRALFALVACAWLAPPVVADEVALYTGPWPPFVGTGDGAPGSAVDVVRKVLLNMGHTLNLEREGYAYGYLAVKQGRAQGAFPYFETRARREDVVFSAPLFTVRNAIYYDVQFADYSKGEVDLGALRVGRVTGYSYGEALDAELAACPISDKDRCPEFASESDAVRALLSHQIDLLPMTDSVAASILADEFPDEALLLRELPDARFSGRSTLHLIAPKTDGGRVFINAFNESHADLLAAGVISSAVSRPSSHRARGASVVRITSAEGFPIIVGVAADDPGAFYAVPEGSRALVLEWSESITQPAADDRLVSAMFSTSLVVMLDGPHVGKELNIRNMHLSIDE